MNIEPMSNGSESYRGLLVRYGAFTLAVRERIEMMKYSVPLAVLRRYLYSGIDCRVRALSQAIRTDKRFRLLQRRQYIQWLSANGEMSHFLGCFLNSRHLYRYMSNGMD